MTGHDIRRTFIEYFARNGHRVVRSSSLVPVNDPTLLFTNAGMNQFKDVFLGVEQRDYKRAVTAQKCVRAGGKHNDLENVGRTARHHTFFEMMGNFSFGDYFKEQAIAFAWELVTREWGIAKDKLYVTVHVSDDDAAGLWPQVTGIAPDRIARLDEDNFWAMGDTGPCGPCSEIFYDFGPAATEQGHADCKFPCDCGRYVEIWNLVFMQFNRDSSGNMNPLPKPCVDTGSGLERVACVLQDKLSNFETDLLWPLVESARTHSLSLYKYGENKEADVWLRIIADHARSTTFLIADGVVPSNEGRGYVLRKIMRRAMRSGRMLGSGGSFFFAVCDRVIDLMKSAYPELGPSQELVLKTVLSEEERYDRTLHLGLNALNDELARLLSKRPDLKYTIARDASFNIEASFPGGNELVIPGEIAFKLHDTYGMTFDMLREFGLLQGFRVDEGGFEEAMRRQRERAKASWKGTHKEAASPVYAKLAEILKTEPDFYYGTSARDCHIEAIVIPGKGAVREIGPGTEAEIVLDRTTFYAESGGQLADVGTLYDNGLSMELAEVRGAYYPVAGLVAHKVVAKETLRVGDRVGGVADAARREHIRRNHTATHLMHAALRNILGTHVKQAGSLVAPDHLRFDFSHFAGVDAGELRDIEQQVNEQILHNNEIETSISPIDEALASGALAFFGDRYPEQNVRVVTVPDATSPRGFYSKELCGGTHVKRTGDIGVFKIVAEQSVAAGTRRVQAITGDHALVEYQHALSTLKQLAGTLNVGERDVVAAVERLSQSLKQLEKQADNLKRKAAVGRVDELLADARTVKDVRVLAARLEGVDRGAMRQLADTLRQKMGSGVVVLGTTEDGKVALISAVTKDLTSRLHAGKIVQELARQVGGSGGGRPDLAEAGGKDTSALESTIGQVYGLVERML